MRAVLVLAVLLAACAPSNVEPEGQQDAGPVCGNGVVEKGEECDNGVRNGPNTGCERDCTWSCLPNDPVRGNAHCDPHDACKGKGTCGFDHICALGAGLPDGEDCGNGHICRDGACQAGTMRVSIGAAAAQTIAAASTQWRSAAERRRSSAAATKPIATITDTFSAAFSSRLIAIPLFALS